MTKSETIAMWTADLAEYGIVPRTDIPKDAARKQLAWTLRTVGSKADPGDVGQIGQELRALRGMGWDYFVNNIKELSVMVFA